MVKLIVFDLDGVLVDSRDVHFETFNQALAKHAPEMVLTRAEHLAKYDGHPTTYKLKLLTREKGLDPSKYDDIWAEKQRATQEYIMRNFTRDERICDVLKELKTRGYTLYCASNSIWVTIKNALYKKGFLEYIDYFVSNEEIKNPKPSPEIYFKCFEKANVSPSETLICEDSPVGLAAARNSGAHVCHVHDPSDLTLDKIIKKNVSPKKLNIVVPAAGLGSRFANAGYTFPKPLIDVNGKPMIQVVTENLQMDGRFIFIVQEDHYEKYNLKYLLNAIAPGCAIVTTSGLTEGSVCSVLLAREHIDNDTPLIIANSDQYISWDPRQFLYAASSEGIDGCISTFNNAHPKFSYVSLDADGYVTETAEKKVISQWATTGVYYWAKGSDYVKYADQMMAKNIRVNGEFYNCPVYNEAIQAGLKFKTVPAREFWCLGTPEDLTYYLSKNK